LNYLFSVFNSNSNFSILLVSISLETELFESSYVIHNDDFAFDFLL